jgi:Sensors of blue-light using FAD
MQMEDLEEILGHARRSNAAQQVTGALVYVDGTFLQVLEGDRATVQSLMSRISADVRHETVTVLKESDIAAPVFRDWRMAYVSATPEQVAQWAGLPGATEVPDILDDLRQDPGKVAQVAQSILSALAAEPPDART